MRRAQTLFALVAIVSVTSCAARPLHHCSTIQTLSNAPRELVAGTPVPPTLEELWCFETHLMARCVERDVFALPSGVPIGNREACWAVPHGSQTCARSSLQALLRGCEIPDLGLVAAWAGSCDAFQENFAEAIFQSQPSGALARYALYVNSLGAIPLPQARIDQMELAATSHSVSGEELELNRALAICQHGRNNPLIGDVAVETIEEVTWLQTR